MTSILEAVQEGRRRVMAHEDGMRRIMLTEYARLQQRVRLHLAPLDARIAAAKALGATSDPQWLQRQAWYRELLASIDAEYARWSNDAATVVANAQRGAVTISGESARLAMATLSVPFAGRVNAPALERLVTALQPGSPVRRVIDGYGVEASQVIRQTLIDGLGTGRGSANITREIVRTLDNDAMHARLSTVVRTESMRAYRSGFADHLADYEERGIVTGYRWIAARSTRTCVACLAMDGRVFATYPQSQHVSCRCVAQPVVRPDLVPGERPRESGEDWFARQPEDVQRRIMPTAGHYDAYKAGTPLSGMVTMRRSRTWGESVAIRPIRDIRETVR